MKTLKEASLLILLLVALLARGDDYPATCAQKILCSQLRRRLPQNNETYNVTFSHEDGSLHFNLTNALGNQLIMTVQGVQRDTFRLIIEEPDMHRYHLEHSLKGELSLNNLSINTQNDTHLTAADGFGNQVEISYQPLHVHFYHNGKLESVFEGKRLIMENRNDTQAFAFAVKFKNAKRFTGLFEHSTILSLPSTVGNNSDPYRMKNLDLGEYKFNWTQSLYGSVPLLYGLGNHTSGLFVHNAAEMWIDLDTEAQSAYFMVNGGVLDLFVLLGPNLTQAVRQYTNLTGTAHMPQLWALGYHQSRYSYRTEQEVRDIVTNFDKYNMPLDAVWLDIDYSDGYKWLTWNKTEFPDPIGLLNWMDSQANRKMVVMSESNIKVDTNYTVYKQALANNYFVNNPNGSAYIGTCWGNQSSWIDFLNPEARNFYAKMYSYQNFTSTSTLAGIWNDMNEPASFDIDKEKTLPDNLVQYGNVPHGHIHNNYGLLQVMATHQGLMERDERKLRPFVLSRSFFAGAQRYAAKWAGDTLSTFDYLRGLVPMTISAGLAGLAFYGADIPGFSNDPTEELATRFYQLGAWIPFFRAHGDMDTKPREPWTFSNETQNLIRDALEIRYKHLPYWYTLFYEHTISGDPIVRPLAYNYPDDDVALDINDEFLVGKDILVANVYFSNATSLRVYFPGENDFWFQITGGVNNVYQGGQWYTIPVNISFIPVFYRSGGIILKKGSVGRSTAETTNLIYDVHIVFDEHECAGTHIYVDDFKSFKYLDENDFLYQPFGFFNPTLGASPIGDSKFRIEFRTQYYYTNNGNGTYSIKKVENKNFLTK